MSNKYNPLLFRALLLITLFFIDKVAFSQQFFGQFYKTEHVHDESCATYHLEEILKEKYGPIPGKEQFEAWMKDRLEDRKANEAIMRRTGEVRVIPVVIHVIHNGTAIGSGANVTMEQVESAIRVLNEDFRRLNADTVDTPVEFRDVAADTEIEFVLAKQDPRGRPTSGVLRVEGPLNSYNPNQALLLASDISYWPASDYLNIWVMPLTAVAGFSILPEANIPGSGPSGLPEGFNGVWMNHRFFGIGGTANADSRGRVLTHEVGHFLGLHHTWGPGNANLQGCDIDDFVEDTPLQFGANNFRCRLTQPLFSCGSRDMSENYMDYTLETCQNLFTLGQLERMDVVLAESPFRASLVNGRAAFFPETFPNDLAMERLIEPQDLACNLDFSPQIIVFNAGSNRVTSTRIELRNNGVLLQSKDFTLDLGGFEEATLTFDPISLNEENNAFEARIVLTNDVPDGNVSNNVLTSNPVIQPELALPYVFTFEDFNQNWEVRNPDDSNTWEETNLTLDGSQTRALVIRNFNNNTEDQFDFFISPRIDLSNLENAQLTFMMAHAENPSAPASDALIVAVSTDCGNNFDILNSNYFKDDFLLETSDPVSREFIPTSSSQFRREILNLSQYAGNKNVRIAFINQSGPNNNIYIKDIEILEEEVYRYDVKMVNLTEPGSITTDGFEDEKFVILNNGNLPITGFLFRRQPTRGNAQLFIFRGELLPGEDFEISLPKGTVPGSNQIDYRIFFPSFDTNPRGDIRLSKFIFIDGDRIQSPWRQGFNNIPNISPWITINPELNFPAWSLQGVQTGTFGENVVVLPPQNGNSYWLGTPVFDMSRSPQGSILFDIAAGQVSPTTVLKILASDNGGINYQEVWRKTGSEITTSSPTVNPNSRNDFRTEFVDISEFAGTEKTRARLAFVVENSDPADSPIYLNNIEYFLNASMEPVRPTLGTAVVFPNPARDFFNIAFNLNSFETVNIQIVNANGMVVHEVDYPNTLNQTYTFSSSNFSKGLFIIKINSRTLSETSKLFIH